MYIDMRACVVYRHNAWILHRHGRYGVCRPPPARLYVPLIPKTVFRASTRTMFRVAIKFLSDYTIFLF